MPEPGVKAIVVGGTGYLGRELVALSKKSMPTICTTGGGGGGIRFDLQFPGEFDYEVIAPGDYVFVLAAVSAPDMCAGEHDRAWAINVSGTSAFVASAVARGARVIFFSSDTVYGEHPDVFDEGAVCTPAGEYARMKHEVEQRFAGNPLFKAIRLSYVFSREDKFTRYLAGCAQRNEEADLFHPFFRAIVHRDDVVAGALALGDRWHEIREPAINFGGPQVLSRVDFAECLREVSFPSLRFRVTEPDAGFFTNRPRVIAMASPIFPRLLGRPARSLCAAAASEFSTMSSIT